MIIVRLLGGLGNQMFQYAAGLALAEARRTVLKLDVSWFREDPAYEAHNRYSLSCFNVTEQFATQEEIDRVRGVRLTRSERGALALARALRLRQCARRHQSAGHWYRASGHRYDEVFAQQPDETYLDGMFQSEKFFQSIAPLLRLHFSFRYPALPEVAALAERIRARPSVFVNFRRGDYVRNPAFAKEIGVLDLDYYHRALRLIRARSPDAVLYLISDDIEAIAREFQPSGPHEFVRCVQPWHAYDQMRLMSLCDHAVIANSTFAWWGAWLNPSPDKLVIAPEPWFADPSKNSADLVPTSWIKLPRFISA